MDKTEIRKEARLYFIPFLLGNNATSRKLSKKIYRKYRIACYILDANQTLASTFKISSKFVKLTNPKNFALTASELIYLAEQCQYTLPILIPCSKEYERLVNEQKDLLESSFVISSCNDALELSPLNIIP